MKTRRRNVIVALCAMIAALVAILAVPVLWRVDVALWMLVGLLVAAVVVRATTRVGQVFAVRSLAVDLAILAILIVGIAACIPIATLPSPV